MRKEDKTKIIEQLAAIVKEYPHFYLVDTTAMNAGATSDFRRECFKAGVKLKVVITGKNNYEGEKELEYYVLAK